MIACSLPQSKHEQLVLGDIEIYTKHVDNLKECRLYIYIYSCNENDAIIHYR